jgi:hypothetical protein
MTATLILAIYGAILSSILAVITVANFLKERRIISVEKHLSFDGNHSAFYDFVIPNISSRPFTILDCHAVNLARTDSGKLEPDWGIEPYTVRSLYGDRKTKPLKIPHILNPGEVIIVGLDTNGIIDQFSFYARTNMETKEKLAPTTGMHLEISHSMSNKLHITKFTLEEDELDRLTVKKEK